MQALKGKKGGDTSQGMTGILSWDEMELREGLLFNVSTGEMVGFCDIDVEAQRRSLADLLDKEEEMEGEEEGEAPPIDVTGILAKKLLVYHFTSFGSTERFSFPVAYFFTRGLKGELCVASGFRIHNSPLNPACQLQFWKEVIETSSLASAPSFSYFSWNTRLQFI